MFNPDFYPTPPNLVNKMLGLINNKHTHRILESSAGKGDIVDALEARYGKKLYSNGSKIDCIEIEPELQALLRGKGHNVIDSDFLAYKGTIQYNTIIMNPPFSKDVQHVMKAWNMIYNGDVIALLNAESIKNPYTAERKLLKSIIEQHGTVEYIKDGFIDAERKTGVEVALIKLEKRNSINTDYFTGMKVAKDEEEISFDNNQLTIPNNRIENAVLAYDMAIECKKKALIASAEAGYYRNLIMGEGFDTTNNVIESLNDYIDDIRESAWRGVVNLADFRKYMTKKVKDEFESNVDKITRMEFTVENIKTFLKNLISGYDDIIESVVEEAFDLMTKYHKDNRVHIEGWKSNDYFFVNKRVVLPYMVDSYMWSRKLSWEGRDKLNDIEKAMAHLAGIPETKTTIDDQGKEIIVDNYVKLSAILEHEDYQYGKAVESTFFKARLYMKGTVHLYFKDLKLLEQLNLVVGRKRAWLPKEDEKVPKEFWLMNN